MDHEKSLYFKNRKVYMKPKSNAKASKRHLAQRWDIDTECICPHIAYVHQVLSLQMR